MHELWLNPWMLWYLVISFVAIIWALIDISHAKKDTGYKFIWALICIVLGLFGVLIYFFIEKSGKNGKR